MGFILMLIFRKHKAIRQYFNLRCINIWAKYVWRKEARMYQYIRMEIISADYDRVRSINAVACVRKTYARNGSVEPTISFHSDPHHLFL